MRYFFHSFSSYGPPVVQSHRPKTFLQRREVLICLTKEPKVEHNLILLELLGHPRDIPPRSRGIPPLSGPTATVIPSRHIVTIHSVALCFPRCRGVSQVNRATPPQKGPVAPTVSALKGVSHFKLLLGRCRATGGCRSHTVACRDTLGHPVPPKSLFPLGFKGHTDLFGPQPLKWKTPTSLEGIWTQKFEFVLRSCRPATGNIRALRARVFQGVSVVSEGVSQGVLLSVQTVSRECQQMFWTLIKHILDAPVPGVLGGHLKHSGLSECSN